MDQGFDVRTALILVQSNRSNARLLFNESLLKFERACGDALGGALTPFDFHRESIQTASLVEGLGKFVSGFMVL